ncbi:MAG: CHAT domain-containing tetratricopeptide repeat protein, partial [Acidobacteriota bacterium]
VASLHDRVGELATARAIHEVAIPRLREDPAVPGAYLGASLNNYALLLQNVGEPELSLAVQQEAYEVRREYYDWPHDQPAMSLANIANLHEQAGDYEAARQSWELALEGQEASADETVRQRVNTHAGLGRMSMELGEIQEAAAHVARSRTLHESLHGRADHAGLSRVLHAEGRLAWTRGNTAEALRAWREATAMSDRVVLRPSDRAARRLHLAQALAFLGDHEDAFRFAMEAEDLGRRQLRSMVRALPEREGLTFARERAAGLPLLLDQLTELPDERRQEWLARAWDAQVRVRALVLDEMASRHRGLLASDDEELQELRRAKDDAEQAHLGHLLSTHRKETKEERAERLERSEHVLQEAERALALRSREFARLQRAAGVGWSEVHDSLPPGSALVSYIEHEVHRLGPASSRPVEHEAQLVALIARSGDPRIHFVQLGASARVRQAIATWRHEVTLPLPRSGPLVALREERYRAAGRELRRLAWDPIAAELGGVDRVFIVPDGDLHVVSFATLPDDDDGYLVESGPLLHYLGAERDLVTAEESDASGHGLLAVGGVAFDDSKPTRAERFREILDAALGSLVTLRGGGDCVGEALLPQFEPLPGSARAVRQLTRLWKRLGRGAARRLTGRRASEAAVVKESPGRRVLHLATHGFVLAPCEQNQQDVGLGGDLLRGGLVLAGVNNRSGRRPENDGVLTGLEVARLDLRGVDWAVLAACDTGRGQVQAGEGVLGLRRAFQVAGVDTLVSSLWAVDDAATREWMLRLYRSHWQEGHDSSESARRASREQLTQLREDGETDHPFYWGAFIATGDWR